MTRQATLMLPTGAMPCIVVAEARNVLVVRPACDCVIRGKFAHAGRKTLAPRELVQVKVVTRLKRLKLMEVWR